MISLLTKRNRSLLSELVRTDFKLRYQGSILGYSWSLLRPLLLFTILYTVFVRVLGVGAMVPHYAVYLLVGVVLWNFFAEMTSQSIVSIVNRGELIRKIRIPRWIIIISSSLSALINLCLTLFVVAFFMVIDHVPVTSQILWVPLILLQAYMFAMGISFFLASMYVKFRDVSYIWEIILQAMFYLTPILYPLQMIKNPLFLKVIMLNPMAEAIQNARYVVVTQETITAAQVYTPEHWWFRLIPYAITVFIFVLGVAVFKKNARYFAENL